MTELDSPSGVAPSPPYANPTWAPAAKDAVGTALGTSRLWFTLAQGIVTEVYYPRPDIPQLKDLGFIVGDGAGFWVELRRLGDYQVAWQDEAIPAITVRHRHARFTLTLRVCADPERDRDRLDQHDGEAPEGERLGHHASLPAGLAAWASSGRAILGGPCMARSRFPVAHDC